MANLEEFEADFGGEEYEPDIIELDGEQFEVIDAMEHEGVNYVALIPYSENDEESDEDEGTEFIVLREVEENGEYYLATIDDDETADEIGELFLSHFDKLFSEYGEED